MDSQRSGTYPDQKQRRRLRERTPRRRTPNGPLALAGAGDPSITTTPALLTGHTGMGLTSLESLA